MITTFVAATAYASTASAYTRNKQEPTRPIRRRRTTEDIDSETTMAIDAT